MNEIKKCKCCGKIVKSGVVVHNICLKRQLERVKKEVIYDIFTALADRRIAYLIKMGKSIGVDLTKI